MKGLNRRRLAVLLLSGSLLVACGEDTPPPVVLSKGGDSGVGDRGDEDDPKADSVLLRPTLLVWHDFERSDDVIEDRSGNALDGSPKGTVISVDGPDGFGKAALLTGESGYVALSDDFPRSIGAVTVAMWVRTNDAETSLGPFTWITAGGQWGWGFKLGFSGGAEFYYNFGADSPYTRIAGPDSADGKWHHLAATVDESESVVYVDGARQDMGPGIAETLMASETQFPALGASVLEGGVTGYQTVAIDEFQVWTEALTEDEIDALRS